MVNYKVNIFQNVIPGKFWNNIPLWGKYTVKFWNNIPLGGKYKDNNEISPRPDLNSRPLVYKTSALTPELRRHVR